MVPDVPIYFIAFMFFLIVRFDLIFFGECCLSEKMCAKLSLGPGHCSSQVSGLIFFLPIPGPGPNLTPVATLLIVPIFYVK